MTLKIKSISSDRAKVSGGDWVAIPDWPGVELQVRGLQYPGYVFAREQLARRLQRRHKGEPAGPVDMQERADERFRLNGELLAEHILIGWKGFDADYDADLALKLLTDPEYETLQANVLWAAAHVGQGKAEFAAELEKN